MTMEELAKKPKGTKLKYFQPTQSAYRKTLREARLEKADPTKTKAQISFQTDTGARVLTWVNPENLDLAC